ILADNSTFTVVVTTQVSDVVDRKLPAEFRSTFTTPDETPAVVTAVDPVAGATEVAVDKVIQVTFNEPLDPQQAFVGVVRVFPDGHPEALVPLVISLSESGTTVTAQPSVPLAESTRYKIEVTSQKDVAGNMQPARYTSTFSTVDRTKPVIDSVSVEGQLLFTKTPLIVVGFHDDFSGIDTASIVLRLDGQDIRAGANVWSNGAQYQVPASAPLVGASHVVEVQVSDRSGNQSDLKSASFTVDVVPPQITSFTIEGFPVVEGMTIAVVRPVLAAVYSDEAGIDQQNTRLRLGPPGGPLAEMPVTFSYNTGLTYQPPADLAEGSYSVQLEVSDNVGNIVTVGPVTFVLSFSAPQLTVIAPLAGKQHGGTVLVLSGTRLLRSDGEWPEVLIGGSPAWVIDAFAASPDQVTVVTPAGAPGPAPVQITTDRGTSTLPGAFLYDTDAKTPFAVEPDTVLLWRFNEPNADWWGVTVDSGPFDIPGYPSRYSQPVEARFGYGEIGAIWSEDYNGMLDFGTSSFTIDCWFKTPPVDKVYLLAGKQVDVSGYGISLLPSGELQGWIKNEAGTQWIVETPSGMSVADDQWHSATLVVDRENGRMAVIVDALERAASPEPPGFGDIGDESDGYVSVGEEDYRFTSDAAEFPGVTDEVRFSSTAHTGDRILRAFEGSVPFSVFAARPEILTRGSTTDFTLEGYNLCQVEMTLIDSSGAEFPGQRVSSSATEARFKIPVGGSAAVGPGRLQFQSPLGTATVSVRILDPERSLLRHEPDTLLLWHLNEAGEGKVKVADSGPLALAGESRYSSSRSLPALFERAREDVSTPRSKFIDFS
ncbi:MAG: hypothetical protein EHM18_18055, partial [Acidobacteria bacterium]